MAENKNLVMVNDLKNWAYVVYLGLNLLGIVLEIFAMKKRRSG